MVRWHHLLKGHEFEQTPGDSEGQGSLACFSSMGSQRVRHDLVTTITVSHRSFIDHCGKNSDPTIRLSEGNVMIIYKCLCWTRYGYS